MSETPLRRSLQPGAGESLLLCTVALDVPYRLEAFAKETRIHERGIYSSPLLSVPLPMYFDLPEGSTRRWAGCEPRMLWHPLFWLPPHLSGRYTIDETGELEDNDTWAVRVALELTASGLYDPVTGGWVDILDLAGIDISSAAGEARVAAWLAGGEDSVLDSIDLEPYLRLDQDPDWSVRSAMAVLPLVRGAATACVADSLRELTAGSTYTPMERATLARLAEALLPDDVGELPEMTDAKEVACAKLSAIAARHEPDFMRLLHLEDDDPGHEPAQRVPAAPLGPSPNTMVEPRTDPHTPRSARW